ncbi:MAG: MATE family efflux transporter [Synergistaceae bacterium]|jgi:putative MATE family efflux protein|nr:MATE family efflux transporter [Synergistaceae bacterium]
MGTGDSALKGVGSRGVFSGRADLGNDRPMMAILKLAIPSMGLFVFNSLLHLVDTIFVSWLGEFPMAAMSFTGPVNMCILATLECVASGSISLMGRNLGRGNVRSARHIAFSGLALMYVVCLLSTPLIIPSVSNALFSNIGVTGNDELLGLCWRYNMWVPIMLPFMGYTYMANTVFRAQGDTMTPFKAIALANTVNMLLDPLFIFTFGWGISGAAIATWVSRIVSSFYILRRLKNGSPIVIPMILEPRRRLMSYWRAILWIGIPVALSTASTALGMGSVNKILSAFGHRVVASWMLGLRVEELAFNFVSGINIALTPFIAFNYGKRDPGRMLAGFKASMILAYVMMGSMGAIIYAYPHFFLSIFRPIPEIGEMSAQAIRASVPGYPFNIFIVLSSGFFVGTGYSAFGTVSQLMRSVAFRVSAAWIFARLFQLSRIWWFQSLSFFLGSFVALAFFLYAFSRIKREFESNEKLT